MVTPERVAECEQVLRSVVEWTAARADAAGLREVAFDGAPAAYGVGVNQLSPESPPARRRLPERLFTFV